MNVNLFRVIIGSPHGIRPSFKGLTVLPSRGPVWVCRRGLLWRSAKRVTGGQSDNGPNFKKDQVRVFI